MKMTLTTIVDSLTDVTKIGTKIDGECTSNAMIHAIAHFLNAIYQSTDLHIVTEGIDEFVEGLKNEDK